MVCLGKYTYIYFSFQTLQLYIKTLVNKIQIIYIDDQIDKWFGSSRSNVTELFEEVYRITHKLWSKPGEFILYSPFSVCTSDLYYTNKCK